LIDGLELARAVAFHADEKQAEDIRVLDLRGISSITDYFVICTGGSMPHLKAIRKEIHEKLKEDQGIHPQYSDGNPESMWMVLDYGNVMVHIFHRSKRELYALEDLWSDAPRLDWHPVPASA